MRDTLKPVSVLRVSGFIAREELRVGDVISYPEGFTSVVVKTDTSAFYIHREPLNPIQKYGTALTFYGNIEDFNAQTKDDFIALADFTRDKLSNKI